MNKYNTSLVMLFSLAVMVIPFLVSAETLSRQLQVGSRGADVSALQTFLAADSSLYPSGLVTGYFGSLTRAAVIRFQARNGISQVGRVGPQTLAAINAQMGGTISSAFIQRAPGFTAPATVSLNASTTVNGSSTATFTISTDMPTRAVVYYSASPIVAFENDNVSPVTVTASGEAVNANLNLQTTHMINSLTLLPNTLYYAMAVVTDANGVVSVISPPSFRTN
jgi:hypothetical protein